MTAAFAFSREKFIQFFFGLSRGQLLLLDCATGHGATTEPWRQRPGDPRDGLLRREPPSAQAHGFEADQFARRRLRSAEYPAENGREMRPAAVSSGGKHLADFRQ